MSGLSPDARAILDAARDGDDPTSADKERVRRAILAGVGSAAAIGAGGASSAAALGASGASSSVSAGASTAALGAGGASTAALGAGGASTSVAASAVAGAAVTGGASAGVVAKLIGVAVAIGIAGGTVALEPWNAGTTTAGGFDGAPVVATNSQQASRPGHTRAPTPVAGSEEPGRVSDPAPPPASAEDLALAERGDGARAGRRARRAPGLSSAPSPVPPPPPVPALADELAILRAAHAARRAGDPARALAELDRHARTFPDGILVAERRAARVFTLCDLGRTEDARALADQFLAAHPGSPLAARVQTACR